MDWWTHKNPVKVTIGCRCGVIALAFFGPETVKSCPHCGAWVRVIIRDVPPPSSEEWWIENVIEKED